MIFIKVLLNGKPVDVWEISKTNEQPDWVKKAFAENYLYWLDNRLRILMCGLNPSMKDNLKVGATGTVGGGFCGYAMYPTGYIGDFIDATNHKLLSKKQFYKKYKIIEK